MSGLRHIYVELKNVYGQEKVYPACDDSNLFADLARQQTLTERDIKIIKALGYQVNVKINTQPRVL